MIAYVIDTETTGLDGCMAGDMVLDVGIVAVDTVMKTLSPVYSEVIGYDIGTWNDRQRNAWIFGHSDLTLEDVSNGKPLDEAAEEVRRILAGNIATSYNVPFDFGKFLLRRPWEVRCQIAPDIMTSAHRLVDGDLEFDDGSTSWPRLEKSYGELCPGDPARLNGCQDHRALSDAMVASYVMLRLVDEGVYPMNIPTEKEVKE